MENNKSFQPKIEAHKKAAFLDLGEFLVIFITLALLIIFAMFRYDIARDSACRGNTKAELKKILKKEQAFYQSNNRYCTFDEISFINPFPFNYVEFSLVSELESQSKEIKIKAEEVESRDAFGDGIPGNQYFIIDQTGTITLYPRENYRKGL